GTSSTTSSTPRTSPRSSSSARTTTWRKRGRRSPIGVSPRCRRGRSWRTPTWPTKTASRRCLRASCTTRRWRPFSHPQPPRSRPGMLEALPVDDATAPYDPYPLGSVIASALWEEASATTPQNISRAVLEALPDLGTRVASGLTIAVILDTLATHTPDAQRSDL